MRQAQVRQDMKGLEDKTDVVAPQRGAGIVIQIRQLLPLHRDRASVGQVQAGNQVEQAGFTRAGLAHDRHNLTFLQLQIQAVKQHPPAGHSFTQAGDLQNRRNRQLRHRAMVVARL